MDCTCGEVESIDRHPADEADALDSCSCEACPSELSLFFSARSHDLLGHFFSPFLRSPLSQAYSQAAADAASAVLASEFNKPPSDEEGRDGAAGGGGGGDAAAPPLPLVQLAKEAGGPVLIDWSVVENLTENVTRSGERILNASLKRNRGNGERVLSFLGDSTSSVVDGASEAWGWVGGGISKGYGKVATKSVEGFSGLGSILSGLTAGGGNVTEHLQAAANATEPQATTEEEEEEVVVVVEEEDMEEGKLKEGDGDGGGVGKADGE